MGKIIEIPIPGKFWASCRFTCERLTALTACGRAVLDIPTAEGNRHKASENVSPCTTSAQ